MFYKNYDGLSAALSNYRILALDLLGMGLSSRPPFHISHKLNTEEKINAAEDFFVEALEDWREKRGIKKMTLLGHSLGGYLSVAYTLKYPSRIERLILVSPVGFPRSPYADHKFISSQDTETDLSATAPTRLSSEFTKLPDEAPTEPRKLPPWVTFLWTRNISPFTFVRIPVVGPKFSSGWTTRRFASLPADEHAAMSAYAYEIFRKKGSGEYAMGYLLHPGAYAKRPLIDRMEAVAKALQKNKTVHLIYGDRDWMDSDSGAAAVRKLKAYGTPADVTIISKAGHNVFLDNAIEFNEEIVRILRENNR